MSLSFVIILIAVGLILLLVELFLLPGTGIAGIIGFVFLIAGVAGAFWINMATGWWVFGGTTLLSVGLLAKFFRSSTWSRFTIHQNVEGKVNELAPDTVHVGDTGVAVSRINPIGKGRFGSTYLEVISRNEYIEENVQIRVTSLSGNKIYVKRHDTSL